MVKMFRSPFHTMLGFTIQHGLVLIALFSVIRIFLVLGAAKSGSYQWVSMIFIAMFLIPVLLLTRQGRLQIGWKKIGFRGVAGSMLLGMVCASIIGMIGWMLYDWAMPNWYVYISQSFSQVPPLDNTGMRFTYFIIFALIGMTFSPFGEELFYRGLIHECFRSIGEKYASIIDAAAFSLVHLAHFGIIWTGKGWEFLPIAGLIWVLLLFITCLVFGYCRRRYSSIWASVAAHAGFNLVMNAFIFYFIL